jgi:hypothetical protein
VCNVEEKNNVAKIGMVYGEHDQKGSCEMKRVISKQAADELKKLINFTDINPPRHCESCAHSKDNGCTRWKPIFFDHHGIASVCDFYERMPF